MDTPDPVPVPSFPSSYTKGEHWLGQVDALTVSHVKNVVSQGLHRHLQILVRASTATMEGTSHVTEQQAFMAVYLAPKFECWS